MMPRLLAGEDSRRLISSAIRAGSGISPSPRRGSAFPITGCSRCSSFTWSSISCSPGTSNTSSAFDSFRRLYGGLDGQALASAIFGTYTASVYLTPIFGGFLADRILGRRRTVLLGALTMAAGHFLMAFEGAFLFALLCLVLGCGMFKGNIASQVGSLYKPEDLRRADAFQIFYLGINAGVIASPLIVGTLGEVYGWHYGFAAAGVGMLLATGIYLSGQKYLRCRRKRSARHRRRAARETHRTRLARRHCAHPPHPGARGRDCA